MCGRVAQYESWSELVRIMRWPGPAEERQHAAPRYNIPPSTPIQLLHEEGQTLVSDLVRWGWRPHWAKDTRLPSNARREKVAHSPYWRALWPHRAIAPINGWFEWVPATDDPKVRLPYYIRRVDGQPSLAAAIGQFSEAGREASEHDGCVIITADAEGGLVDVHDRRPVILPPGLAGEWLDASTPLERAEQILLHQSEPPAAFEWYRVSSEANNAKHQGPHLIERT
ncbi:SOS response-associated peptidase [Pseudomonas citronellolis]|uniref:SOS response-associated peptidase n=1 Tax=Pseudomonas citronellolis TaxID=53408 RepID=UPI00264A0933|nr:SOS response-associated peptidase [Pseudomonas citronellolis]MDN6872961.1 SOS response-associated peptidase [Pseudomonas citronellolis]